MSCAFCWKQGPRQSSAMASAARHCTRLLFTATGRWRGFGETALHAAAAHGDVFLVQELLDAGAHKDARQDMGHRPLHVAAFKGHLDVVRLLVDSKADTELEDEDGRMPYEVAEDPKVTEWFREHSIQRSKGRGATKSYP